METKKYSITKKAREIGFDLVGFSRPEINSFAIENYKTFLKKNYKKKLIQKNCGIKRKLS